MEIMSTIRYYDQQTNNIVNIPDSITNTAINNTTSVNVAAIPPSYVNKSPKMPTQPTVVAAPLTTPSASIIQQTNNIVTIPQLIINTSVTDITTQSATVTTLSNSKTLKVPTPLLTPATKIPTPSINISINSDTESILADMVVAQEIEIEGIELIDLTNEHDNTALYEITKSFNTDTSVKEESEVRINTLDISHWLLIICVFLLQNNETVSSSNMEKEINKVCGFLSVLLFVVTVVLYFYQIIHPDVHKKSCLCGKRAINICRCKKVIYCSQLCQVWVY